MEKVADDFFFVLGEVAAKYNMPLSWAPLQLTRRVDGAVEQLVRALPQRQLRWDYNTLIGKSAGSNISTGDGNVVIGVVDAASATGDRQLKIAGYDGSTTTTWITGDSSGNVTVSGTVTANGETLSAGVSAGFAVAMAIAL